MPSETLLSEFRASLSFPLDAYQLDACRVLDSERSVLVAAPTGAGKTLVGEYAITRALAAGEKAFYTAPIKALSNQKYHDLVALHGAEAVGLLTGDTSVNGEAPVVVMTTEVLRNMLYSGSDTLNGLRYVVMDEVHYLADRFRGSVWEEVIIHLDPDVLVVALSATVSNAEEFGDWLAMVRGDCGVIVSEHRPVPLYQHVAVSQGKYDLPALLSLKEAQRLPKEQRQAQTRQRGSRQGQSRRYQSRQDYAREDQSSQRSHRHDDHDQRAPHQRSGSHHRPAPLRRPPRRSAVVEALEQEHLLPAIFFIFSRVGCDKAVSQCLRAGLTLTTPQEEAEIRFLVENRAAEIPPEDLDVLEYWQWSAALARGIASHHAGLLPVFKQTVEELFVRGLIKVVFATETLALGINMPARSVVLEKLVKFNGISHEPLTAGEYTQLTGRAGRRGIDVEGHAVVVDQPALNVGALANLSTRRTYPLNSAFTPSYNMAVNLIAHAGDARAREILEMSFAQFQTDRSVVGLAKKAQSMPDNRARKKLIKRITSMTGTITRTYDMNCGVLEELGYLRRSHGELTVTEQGQWLRTIYTESDLLLAECLRSGIWDDLDPASLAATVSTIVYSGRSDDGTEVRVPHQAPLREALKATNELWDRLVALEDRHGIEGTGDLDPGMTTPVYLWSRGRSLETVLRGSELTPGDFVRWCKQVIDVLDQLTHAAPTSALQATARRAKNSLQRGVVAFSTM